MNHSLNGTPTDSSYAAHPTTTYLLLSKQYTNGGTVYPGGLIEGFQPDERDLPESYQNQVDEFELTDRPKR